MDMVNVSLELKDPKGREGAGSLARCGSHYIALFYNNSNTVTLIQVTHRFCFSREQRFRSAGWQWNVVCRVLFQSSSSPPSTSDSIGCTLVTGTRKYQWFRTGKSFSSCYRGLGRLWSLQSPRLTEQTESLGMPARKIRALEGLPRQLMPWQTSWGRTWAHTCTAEAACSRPVSAQGRPRLFGEQHWRFPHWSTVTIWGFSHKKLGFQFLLKNWKLWQCWPMFSFGSPRS